MGEDGRPGTVSQPADWRISAQRTQVSSDGAWQEVPTVSGDPGHPRLGGFALPAALRDGGGGGDPRYGVDGSLGTGATAGVWSVYDHRLKRPLAAKVLCRPAQDRQALATFLTEARTTAGLQHPNVVPIHDVDVAEDGRPYFTMNRIDGLSLGRVIGESTATTRHPLISDVNAVVSMVISVANALAYAHHRGLVHQDVKPDNIMLGRFGEVLLVDWGSAQSLAEGKRKVCGTPVYMSPEQACGRQVDQRSDIYCLGATLLHALTLRLPLWEEDVAVFWKRKHAGDFDRPTAAEAQRLPSELLAITCKAMEADPARRYQTAEAFIEDLRSFQAGLAVSAQPESRRRRLLRFCRRHARSIAIALPIVACIVSLAVLLYGQQLKQMAVWGQPVFRDALADPALPGWEVLSGGFEVRDGVLTSRGATESLLVLRRRFDGDVAVEYEAWIQSGARLGDLSMMWFPEYPTLREGTRYIDFSRALQVQFGARDGSHSMITLGDRIEYDATRPEAGRRYRVRVEVAGTQLSMFVDGRLCGRHNDALPLHAGHLALYAFYPGKAFADLRVYVRRQPELVPVTALGDVLMRRGQAKEAAAEYAQAAADHPGTSLAAEASFRCGVAWAESGDLAAADQAWSGVRGSAWEDEVEMLRLDWAVKDKDHRRIYGEIDRLAAARPWLRPRLANSWFSGVQALCRENAWFGRPALLEAYLGVHDRHLRGNPATEIALADALLGLERWQEVLDRAPGAEGGCCAAAHFLGHPEWVPQRWPNRTFSVRFALLSMARFDELAAFSGVGYDPELDPDVLIAKGRSAEVLARDPANPLAALNCGRFDILLADPKGRGYAGALVLAGRAAEVPVRHARDPSVLMALGRVDQALQRGEEIHSAYAWPRFLLAVRSAVSGDHAAAVRWLEIPPAKAFTQICLEPARTLIAPFLRELAGDREAFQRSNAEIIATRRWADQQRPWHTARYLSGELDAAGYRAQPLQRYLEADLLLAQAIQAERRGHGADALVAYRAWSALPRWQRSEIIDPVSEEFVAWRTAILSPKP